MKTLKKGSEIVCPDIRCGEVIARLKIDLEQGMYLKVEYFEFQNGQDRTTGENMKCKTCGSAYSRTNKSMGVTQLHTEDGWV